MEKIKRGWRAYLEGIDFEPETHEQVDSQEIVEPPQEGEDQEQAHGGNDVCSEVEDAPEREEAQGESSQSSSLQSSEETEERDSESSESPEISREEEEENSKSPSPQEQATSESEEASPSEDNSENETSEASESEEGFEDDENSEASESEEEDSDNDEISEASEIENEQDDSNESYGDYQRQSLYDDTSLALRVKRLQNAVATIISKVAEDLSYDDNVGDDLWDMNALMTRKFTHKSLYHCRKGLKRENVIIALDFSGSCSEYSEFFYSILRASEDLQDVEIFDASNGFEIDGTTWSITNKVGRPFSYFKNRTIIFFGDFDGGYSLVELSKIAKVYWFSSEERYTDLSEHDWCYPYTLKDFKGKYFHPCTDESTFLRLLRKVR